MIKALFEKNLIVHSHSDNVNIPENHEINRQKLENPPLLGKFNEINEIPLPKSNLERHLEPIPIEYNEESNTRQEDTLVPGIYFFVLRQCRRNRLFHFWGGQISDEI